MITIDQNSFIEIGIRSGSIIFIVILTLIVQRVVKKVIQRKESVDVSQSKQIAFLTQIISAVIYLLGFVLCVYIIPELRSLSASIFAGSGVLAIIFGFASQHAFSNLVSGIFITIFKPFRVGDKVKFIGKDVVGVVEDITMRHTVVRTFENKRVIIPNSIVSVDIIENAHIVEEKVCRFFEIGISYDSDLDTAIAIIEDEIKKHADYYDNRTDEEKIERVSPVKVKVLGFSDSSVNLRAWVWAKDNATSFDMVCDLNKSIKKRFDNEGIEIPFPHRTLVFKNQREQIGT